MADIRKRTGSKGTTYQVRYPSKHTKSGYAYATFDTMKEARAFLEGGQIRRLENAPQTDITTVKAAAEIWLRICEKEGLNGREPVTAYTIKNYEYRAEFIKAYEWPKPLQELTPPDVVAFRSWLLRGEMSRDLAGKVMATLHSVMKEMTIRGIITYNIATGITIRADSRYSEPMSVPSKREVLALLEAADQLANSKNRQIARTWERYRPILYLAADSGMRPQEYLAVANSAFDDCGVHVKRAIDGSGYSLSVTKTSAGRRYIELSPAVLEMVRSYGQREGNGNEYDLVFPAENGRWMCRKNWQRRGFNVACLKAGLSVKIEKDGEEIEVPKYRPYDLRHFFASLLIEKKTNLKKIQTLMGHTNIETTLNVYGHLLEDEGNDKVRDAGLLGSLIEDSCGNSVASIS